MDYQVPALAMSAIQPNHPSMNRHLYRAKEVFSQYEKLVADYWVSQLLRAQF
jgi:hypothetical protein